MKNVRAIEAGVLARGWHDENVRLIELPTGERGPILREFLRQVRGGVRFFDSPDPEAVVSSADRYPVFRVISN